MNIFILVCVAILLILLLLSLRRVSPACVEKIVEEWGRPQSIFALMFYGTFVYLVLVKAPIPEMLNSIVNFLMGFFFGQKVKNTLKDITDDGATPKT